MQGGGGGGAGSGSALVWVGVSASGVGAASGGGSGVATGFPVAGFGGADGFGVPSSTPHRRPSTGTCSSSGGGLNRGRKPGDDGVAVSPPHHRAFNRAGLLRMRRSRSRRVDEWRSVCAVGVRLPERVESGHGVGEPLL